MNIFDYAIEIEEQGEAYYRELAEKANNEGLESIFSMLADEEVKHHEIFEELKQNSKPELASTDVLSNAKDKFASLKGKNTKFSFDSSQSEMYKKAQDIEKKSMDFYTEKAGEVDDEYQKEMFLKIAEEEKKHYHILDNIIDFVRKPETWLENAEWHHLEEY